MNGLVTDSLAFRFVDIQRYGEIAVLTINDPPANTLTYDLVAQLDEAFFELSLDSSVRSVVITGSGPKFFSGGVNIGMLRSVTPHYNSNFLLFASEVFDRIDKSPLLVVAAINGHATGGGLELALVADVRFAVEGSYNIGFPEVRLGVIPGLGGTQRLARLVGRSQALELITEGSFVSVERAKALGIVDGVLPRERFLAAVIDDTGRRLRKTRPTGETLPEIARWTRPNRAFVTYRRDDNIGTITLLSNCADAPSLQVLRALHEAILAARLDNRVEAVLITHEAERLRLGTSSHTDKRVWSVMQSVCDSLENFPRLCVIALRGALEPMTSELALACDYRFVPHAEAADSFLVISTQSPRCNAYLPAKPEPTGELVCVRGDQAIETGLVRVVSGDAWPNSVLAWLERFVSPRGASKSIGYAKLAVVRGSALPYEAGALLERHLQEQLFRGNDGPEGMQAYLEKRAAVFTGA